MSRKDDDEQWTGEMDSARPFEAEGVVVPRPQPPIDEQTRASAHKRREHESDSARN